MPVRFGTLVVCVALVSGCATGYLPRPGPRLSIVMREGALGYQRDGRFFSGGLFGGEIEQAVAGDPQASEHARAYRSGTITGFALTLGGLGTALVGGIAPLAFLPTTPSGSWSVPLGVSLASLLAGLGLELAGTFVVTSAQPHFYDAINVFNDHVEMRRPIFPGPAAPPPPPTVLPSLDVGSAANDTPQLQTTPPVAPPPDAPRRLP